MAPQLKVALRGDKSSVIVSVSMSAVTGMEVLADAAKIVL